VICHDASRGGGIRTHDLFVPNENFSAFVGQSCVDSTTNPQVTSLVLLVTTNCGKVCCGLTADCALVSGHHRRPGGRASMPISHPLLTMMSAGRRDLPLAILCSLHDPLCSAVINSRCFGGSIDRRSLTM
jgi:hypothetical protein